MKTRRLLLLPVLLICLIAFGAQAQKSSSKKPVKKSTTTKPVQKTGKPATKKTTTPAPVEKKQAVSEKTTAGKLPANATEEEQKVRDMIAFLQYVLNTLGSQDTPARDKDVLITESYTKIFRDAKVQVEDDLDANRKVITNKDVVAYLKDVDFFFKNVKFEFAIEDIRKSTLAGGSDFYKVTLRRNLSGTTADGKVVNNTQVRYIEINYHPDDQDLKIVSIYTNEFDEKEALTAWWNDLSYEWQSIFTRKLNLTDSVDFEDIKKITAIEELDLSGNTFIRNIEPLTPLVGLKLLNLSHTSIADLTPIRNLTELVELNVSSTKVFDLTPLKYATKLQRLDIGNTDVRSIAAVEKMSDLRNLEMASCHVIDFTPLSNLSAMVNLNAARTQLSDLAPLKNLSQLVELNAAATDIDNLAALQNLKALATLSVDSTAIKDLKPLAGLSTLKVLSANHTKVASLDALLPLPGLERIYCDQSHVTPEKADAFMAVKPGVLIIFDSKELSTWWNSLPSEWQQVFSKAANTGPAPAKETLARITNLDSINIGNKPHIQTLEPLRKLGKLRVLLAANTGISDVSPLQHHRGLHRIDITGTPVHDLSPLKGLVHLRELRADRTKIESIETLAQLTALEKLYVDQTTLHDITAREYLEKNPRCLLIFKTNHLNRWWNNLGETWRNVFRNALEKDTTATRENLHKLAELEKLDIREAGVTDLSALNEMVRLKTLSLSGTGVRAIPALENIKSLQTLHATNSPLENVGSLAQFGNLEDLDLSNTPVDDLKPLAGLQTLVKLNVAGTQLKKLDPLKGLSKLVTLDCSNTKVTNLDAIFQLPLKTLKCYNTRITEREVKNFRDAHPDCNVVYYR